MTAFGGTNMDPSPLSAAQGSISPPSASPQPAALPRAAAADRARTIVPFEISRDFLKLAAAFLAGYLLLVWWGIQLSNASGVTSWYPPAGLAIAAVTLGGRPWIAVTLVAALMGGLLHGIDHVSMWLLGAAIKAAVYGGAGLALRARIDPCRPLVHVSDAWWLIGIGIVAAPVASAVLTVGGMALLGLVPVDASSVEMIRTWILGDALGVASIAPGVIFTAAIARRHGYGKTIPGREWHSLEVLAALLLLVSVTPAVYFGAGDNLLALAALPLCWLALRFGVPGAVIGSFTWGASSALLLAFGTHEGNYSQLQACLLTGTMVSLIIGAVVSERERSQRQLHHFAMHDPASGLPNEPSLLMLLDDTLESADAHQVTTMLIRFAGLRQVGSALRGQDTDQLVALLGQELRTIVGPDALIARPGYDRFAVVMLAIDSGQRQWVAQQIIERTSAPMSVAGREVFVDPRVGVTVAVPGESAAMILAHADTAADVAEVAQGRRVSYFDASTERAQRERQELTEDLRTAVERGEFQLAFQPIVTAKEGRVVAAEALLRWVDQRRGNVPPFDFVPVAEETGLILPIGRWVLNEACSRATQWPHVGGEPIAVSVNVSPIQLLDEGFVDDVAAALERSGLPARRLRVEITEGIELQDIERTISMIHQLRGMGVDTMLDDFGTGHSSLAWVQRLPVTCIKIDRAFIKDIASDGIDRAIVHASLYLSRALGTDTVAEGVETEAQREQLIRMGCQHLQGYLFARPQPAAVFPDWLAKQRALVAASPPAKGGLETLAARNGRFAA
jgi:EAL domain-containing protein (putative c-di-GMP-specific phosphodiesterase class I)/GGDEF domain-containing protein